LPGGEIGWSHLGRAVVVMNELAEWLARDVNTGVEALAASRPSRRTACEHVDVAVAMAPHALGGDGGKTVSAVADHDARGAPRHHCRKPHLETAQRQVRSEQDMTVAGEDAFLAHVDQRDLCSVVEDAAQG